MGDSGKKIAQIKALVLVVALELEKLEFHLLPKKKKRRISNVQLTVIQGGKDHSSND